MRYEIPRLTDPTAEKKTKYATIPQAHQYKFENKGNLENLTRFPFCCDRCSPNHEVGPAVSFVALLAIARRIVSIPRS